MLIRNIKYTDFNGTERDEPFYFNISKSEAVDMELEMPNGYSSYINEIVTNGDKKEMAGAIKRLILTSYGTRTPDGKFFIKSDEEAKKFFYSRAFDALYMEFLTDSTGEKLLEFVNGVFPNLAE